MKHGIVFTAALAAALTACGGGEEGGEGAELGQMDTASSSTQAEPAAAGGDQAQAQLTNASGQQVGTVTLTESGGGVQLAVQVNGIAPGTHGIHIHQVGTCTAPDFSSAGGHFNPTQQQHGLENPQGPHAGDLPNLEVGADSTASTQLTNERVTLGSGPNSLFDTDGSAIVIHATRDDQTTDPSGNSGDRVACGVINRG